MIIMALSIMTLDIITILNIIVFSILTFINNKKHDTQHTPG